MSREVLQDWICGEPVDTVSLEGPSLQDPNTGDLTEPMVSARSESITRALSTAAEVHRTGAWSGLQPHVRADILDQIANALEGETETLAELGAATTGVVISQTERFAGLVPLIFRKAGALVRDQALSTYDGPFGAVEVHRLPLGPALCIAPWNAPTAIAAHKVASALAAGCPTILKPSEWTPHTANVLARAIHKTELPAGTFQLVHGRGDVGARLTDDERVRAVSFTGGLAGGRAVAVSCAQQMKPAQLELGGNNPLIVLRDADVDVAADGIVTALTRLNGQWCRALGRVLIHRSLEGQVLEAVGGRLRSLRLGHSLKPESEMGPLIHRGHFEQVQGRIDELCTLGGTAHSWTPKPEAPGFFCPGTLITGCAPNLTTEEVFGPVASVHAFDTEAEMFELAHQAPYGLAAYIFGDEERSLEWARRFEIGSTKINGVTVTSLNPEAPRSAWRLSGLGVEGHRETYDFFRGIGVVGVAGRN